MSDIVERLLGWSIPHRGVTYPLAKEAATEITRLRARLAEKDKALEPSEDDLPFVVQYRRKDDGVCWTNMAAFDTEGPAERYCRECAGEDRPWEYRVARRARETWGCE